LTDRCAILLLLLNIHIDTQNMLLSIVSFVCIIIIIFFKEIVRVHPTGRGEFGWQYISPYSDVVLLMGLIWTYAGF